MKCETCNRETDDIIGCARCSKLVCSDCEELWGEHTAFCPECSKILEDEIVEKMMEEK